MNQGLEVLQLIKTTLELRGKGEEGNPYRRIEQYWTMDGALLFEYDTYTKQTKWFDGREYVS